MNDRILEALMAAKEDLDLTPRHWVNARVDILENLVTKLFEIMMSEPAQ